MWKSKSTVKRLISLFFAVIGIFGWLYLFNSCIPEGPQCRKDGDCSGNKDGIRGKVQDKITVCCAGRCMGRIECINKLNNIGDKKIPDLKEIGNPCEDSDDCPVGISCIDYGYCTKECERDEDCPKSMKCFEGKFPFRSGNEKEWKESSFCVLKDTCLSNKDCASNPLKKVCIVKRTGLRRKIVYLACGQKKGDFITGDECDYQSPPPAPNSPCKNGIEFCFNGSICTKPCREDSECPKDWVCIVNDIFVDDSRLLGVHQCVPYQVANCSKDDDCKPPFVCHAFEEKGKIYKYCFPRYRGENIRGEGEVCEPNKGFVQCYNSLCIDVGTNGKENYICAALCKNDNDCSYGVCKEVNYLANQTIKVCVPEQPSPEGPIPDGGVIPEQSDGESGLPDGGISEQSSGDPGPPPDLMGE